VSEIVKASISSILESQNSGLQSRIFDKLVESLGKLTEAVEKQNVALEAIHMELVRTNKRINPKSHDDVGEPQKKKKQKSYSSSTVLKESLDTREALHDAAQRTIVKMLSTLEYRTAYQKLRVHLKKISPYDDVVFARMNQKNDWWPATLVSFDKLSNLDDEILLAHPLRGAVVRLLEEQHSHLQVSLPKKLADNFMDYVLVHYKFDRSPSSAWCMSMNILPFQHDFRKLCLSNSRSLRFSVQNAVRETPLLVCVQENSSDRL